MTEEVERCPQCGEDSVESVALPWPSGAPRRFLFRCANHHVWEGVPVSEFDPGSLPSERWVHGICGRCWSWRFGSRQKSELITGEICCYCLKRRVRLYSVRADPSGIRCKGKAGRHAPKRDI
jgi:hypothetical protein